MPLNLKYGAEAIALLGIAYGLIKWIGRSVRSLGSDPALEDSRIVGLDSATAAAAARALTKQGVISATELAKLPPKERDFLLAASAPRLGAAPASLPAVAATDAKPRPLTPAHLRLITPSRPPLGFTVHCPSCGAVLDRDALQRFGTTTCAKCRRPVSAHIQRGRVTVIVEETADEGAHRRQLEAE